MDTKLVQSRRNFIKGIGAAVMGAGIVHAANAANAVAADTGSIVWDEEYDVVVVGAGMAGLTAAAVAANEGNGASVLLLEKGSDTRGNGNSKFSSGYAITIPEGQAPIFADYMKTLRGSYNGTPDEYIDEYCKALEETLPYAINELGAKEEDIQVLQSKPVEWVEYPNSPATSSVFKFNSENEDGLTHCTLFMLDVVENKFADVITEKTESPLVALVQDPETRTILGCVYENEGTQYYVKANKGVVMCTGGFENDPIMRQDYLGLPVAHPVAGQCNTGDGHRICMKCGADLWHMNSVGGPWTNAVKLDGSAMLEYRGLKKDQGITVGINGRRFYDDWDALSSYEQGERGDDLSLYYGSRHGKNNYGGGWTSLPLPETTWFVFDSVGLDGGAYRGGAGTTFDNQNNAMSGNTCDPVADGYGYRADTLEELAEQMGVNVDAFVTCVEQWNNSVANGEDEFFHRPASTLIAVATPPFYAVKCVPEFLCTNGGPRRSPRGEILDVDGLPIPHLFSAGEFGGTTGNKHESCSNLGECWAFGLISGRNVLKG